MEKFFTHNAEGCSIHGKLYAENPGEVNRLVLYGHGFGGHKDNKAAARFARHMLEKNRGTALLCFDWPCHGDDARKKLRLEDCDAYLRLMLAWAQERFDSPELYGYATSFGGYLFLKYLSEHGNPFRKLALRCPAVDMYAVLCSAVLDEEKRRKLERGRPVLAGFDRKLEIDGVFVESLREADITKRDFLDYADDLFILHGTKDELVPIADVRAFAEDNVIDFEAVEGANHRFQDPRQMDHAVARIAAFFGMR